MVSGLITKFGEEAKKARITLTESMDALIIFIKLYTLLLTFVKYNVQNLKERGI